MILMSFNFTPSPAFVKKGFEDYKGEFSDSEKLELLMIRRSYPELRHWGDYSINIAWAGFSQRVYLISWVNIEAGNRNELFLNFCYWEQCKGTWPWGNDIERLAKIDQWKQLST
jgi:hypothetical protein